MKLSNLMPSVGSRKERKRVGRGESSGLGKTSGRGGKGQTARSGGTIRPGFEGGQMPLYRRVPKFGFRSRQKTLGTNQFNPVNLHVLDGFEDGAVVDAEALRARGYGRTGSRRAGYKVLGTGELSKRLTVRVQAVSESARAKIEAAGGTVEIIALKGDAASEAASAE